MKAAIKTTVGGDTISDHTAALLVQMAEKFYSDPKNQRGFAAWQAEQRKNRTKGGKCNGKK